jgi:hypothetical protein
VLDHGDVEGGQRRDLVERGRGVADAGLDRAELRGADVPADLRAALDGAGAGEVVDGALVVRPRRQRVRETGGRQLLEDHRAVRGVPGVDPPPRGGRGGQGQQRPDRAEHGADQGDRLVAGLDADVDVQPVDEHLATPPAGARQHPLVPLRHGLGLRVRDRVRPAAGQHEAPALGRLGELLEDLADLRDRGADRVVHPGDDLDRVEQELVGEPRVRRAARGGEVVDEGHALGPGLAGGAVEHLELPLDAERRASGLSERGGHGDILPPDGVRRRTTPAPSHRRPPRPCLAGPAVPGHAAGAAGLRVGGGSVAR